MAANRALVVRRLYETLLAARRADGVWGYFADRAGRLEPTSWAMLALVDADAGPLSGELHAGLSLFAGWQQPNGLLADAPRGLPNLAFNGLAALVLRRMREREVLDVRGLGHVEATLLDGIRATKGVRTRASNWNRQDNRLQGWPWVDQTFSWVEPTAWCLLALKKARRAGSDPRLDARIDEANRLLVDRCCTVGGWNYGNSNMFGKELHPYVPTTALALIALQDQRNAPEVTRSLRWLKENENHEMSGMALSLALLAAIVYRHETEPLETLLCGQIMQTQAPSNLATVATALYALTGSQHEAAAITI